MGKKIVLLKKRSSDNAQYEARHIAPNGIGLCVRWGFPALKLILKTKINYMTELDLKNESPNDAKPVLADSKKFAYDEAYSIALRVLELLRPHCIRCEIAGSIRREKGEVKDIEIVAIPKPYQTGLFQDGIAEIVNQWQKVKGELEYGKTKYTQRVLPEGIKMDLFFAEEGNWGLIFAIRTGSADYSHKVLANGWVKRGYKSEGGYLMQNGKTYEVREEKDLFDRIGVAYVEPKHRTL